MEKKNLITFKRKAGERSNNINRTPHLSISELAFKLMVPKRGTKLQDGHLTEGIVHIHVRKDCMEKAKCNPSEIIIPEFYKLTSSELAEIAERGQFKF